MILGGAVKESDKLVDTETSSKSEYWGESNFKDFGKTIQQEMPQESAQETTSTPPQIDEKPKTPFKDGINFAIFANSVGALIGMGSLGALAAPAAIIILILLVFFGFKNGWKFILAYFLTTIIIAVIIVFGFLALMNYV